MNDRLLNELDHRRITLLREKHPQHDIPPELDELIDTADTVSPAAMPPDRVTMYSQFLVEEIDGTGQHKLVVCYPPDSEPTAGYISVLSPLGAALLGWRCGETVSWTAPGGAQKSLRIVTILFQPEASGDYIL
jgi:regulator of nucleoside diphosphate kinase